MSTPKTLLASMLLLLTGVGVAMAQAPTVGFGTIPDATPGGSVTAPIEFDPGSVTGIRTLEFDVSLPTGVTPTSTTAPICTSSLDAATQGVFNCTYDAGTNTLTGAILPCTTPGSCPFDFDSPITLGSVSLDVAETVTFPADLPITAVECLLAGAAPADPACVGVDGQIDESTAAVTLGDATFGNVLVGQTSPAQTVQVTNTTASAITIDASTITVPTGYSFTAGTCPASLGNTAPNNTCDLSVTCAPTAAGDLSGVITHTPSGATGNLSCTGTEPVAVVIEDVDFGDVAVGTTSAQQPVMITNNTTAPIDASATALQASAGYAIADIGDCTATLGNTAPNNTCTIQVTCTPAMAGANPGTITHTPTGTTGTLACNGTVGMLSVSSQPSPPMLMTGDQATFTLENTGAAPVTVTTGAFETGGLFNIVTDNCDTMTLQPGGTCDVTVEFIGDEASTDNLTFSYADPAGAPLGDLQVTLNGGQEPFAIPTLSQWSMILVGSLLAMLAMVGLRRQS